MAEKRETQNSPLATISTTLAAAADQNRVTSNFQYARESMTNYFNNLGFDLADRKEFERLVRRAARSGNRIGKAGRIHYILWAPGAGIELWVQMTPQETLIGCNPFLSGVGQMRMGVMQIAEDPNHPVDGFLQGWANPEMGQTDSGLYPFAVNVPDFHLVREKVLVASVIHLRVSAFAHSLHCYQDEDDFRRHPRTDDEARLGPEAFLPVGVLEETSGKRRAEAVFTGRIHTVEVRANPVTGRKFHVLAVQTLGGLVDVVADPSLVTGLPVAGGLVYGTFWLAGRLLRIGH